LQGVDADTAGCLLASAGQYNLPNLLNACQDILIADLQVGLPIGITSNLTVLKGGEDGGSVLPPCEPLSN